MTFSLAQPGQPRLAKAFYYTSVREARPKNPLALPSMSHPAMLVPEY
jgi:hypothetical protein